MQQCTAAHVPKRMLPRVHSQQHRKWVPEPPAHPDGLGCPPARLAGPCLMPDTPRWKQRCLLSSATQACLRRPLVTPTARQELPACAEGAQRRRRSKPGTSSEADRQGRRSARSGHGRRPPAAAQQNHPPTPAHHLILCKIHQISLLAMANKSWASRTNSSSCLPAINEERSENFGSTNVVHAPPDLRCGERGRAPRARVRVPTRQLPGSAGWAL